MVSTKGRKLSGDGGRWCGYEVLGFFTYQSWGLLSGVEAECFSRRRNQVDPTTPSSFLFIYLFFSVNKV